MARLLPKPYPLPEIQYTGDFNKGFAAHKAAFEAIPQDRVIRFPRGDGYALYFVVSVKPVVLQWIPFSDRWQVEPALIRGLRPADIKSMLDGARRVQELFGGSENEFAPPPPLPEV